MPVAAEWNAFGHARDLLGPETKFVSPNNYVLQFVDAWTNNFAYVGTRATGNAAAEFLIAPPGYAGGLRRACA